MSSNDINENQLKYLTGFGNDFQSEDPRCPRALPEGQNTPQTCPYGLYAESMNGSSFTAPRGTNKRAWFYRIRPSVCHGPFTKYEQPFLTDNWHAFPASPNHPRWQPFLLPKDTDNVDFVDGLRTLAGAGSAKDRRGCAIHIYVCNQSMGDRAFYNSDGDFLIVPQQGELNILTEFGRMVVAPGEVCVIQQGMRFHVAVDGPSRGYILETFEGHFRLPDLGLIGANGLANPRDFLTPVALYEDRDELPDYELINKFGGSLFEAHQNHSPFDVVAWHGNYVPYKYDLRKFVPVNTVARDYCDPTVFTVLTAPSGINGGPAVADFLAISERWEVTENTFRPSYFHRNCAVEFMGKITDSPSQSATGALPGGIQPGGAQMTAYETAHGPSANATEHAFREELKPTKVFQDTLVFFFLSPLNLTLTAFGQSGCGVYDDSMHESWIGIKKHFNPTKRELALPTTV
ncbi:Homogentisate 1,2-dioxygenase [Hypsibius exemplaris]|uniref:Homogentisate 1,2-dioxygenase n=1 Tax=Hypsibius exemplaris TaxID=2072580 RepID=A0A1W0WZ58_HYPEX|nr:Homogentisate 1,2-dioxygenase [Hypsibius exemplaris]